MQNMRNTGFTLIELMTVIVILGIFASIALPGFNALIQSNRTKSTADEFQALLVAARTDAVTKRTSVSVSNTDGTWSTGERQLTVPDSISMSAGTSTITFKANGSATESTTTFSDSSTTYTIETKPAGLIKRSQAQNETTE